MCRILFVRDHLHHSNREMLEGIRRFARSYGWRITLCRTPRSDLRTINDLALRHKADGVIVEATTFKENRIPFTRPHVPTVFINGPDSFVGKNTAVVRHDSAGTGIRAADTMIALGLHNFYYTPYPLTSEWDSAREEGFRARLTQSGFTCSQISLTTASLKHLLTKREDVGIFAANDEVATSILKLTHAAGIDVPRQLVILGVDDSPQAKTNNLSSIRVDFEMGGYLAAKTLHGLLVEAPTKRICLYGDLGVIHRRSTRHIPFSSPILSRAVQFIRQNACSGISVPDVTALFPGSRRNAERYFREATGHSIHEEISKIRYEKLLNLLADPSVPLTSIHLEVGYATPQALRKAFRLHTGMSMCAWRKNQQTKRDGL